MAFYSQPPHIDGHNASGIGQRHQVPLRIVYNAATLDDPYLAPELALCLSVKAIRDTMGPNSLVPVCSFMAAFSNSPGKTDPSHR